jgi:hypothetical protein
MHDAQAGAFFFITLLVGVGLICLVVGVFIGRRGRAQLTSEEIVVWLMDCAAHLDGSLDYEATILLNAANLLTGAEDDDLTLADQRGFDWPKEG